MSSNSHALYHFTSCPFCSRVRDAIARLGIEVELRDIQREPDRERELFEATGRQTVPCLRIEGESGDTKWMHESADIIAYLESSFAA